MLSTSTDNRPPEDILDAAPLLRWIAWRRKSGSEWAPEPNNRLPRDLMLSPSCSSRFCMSMEDEEALALAADEEDLNALTSVTWDMAAFRRNLRGGDFLILSCSDVGAGNVDAPEGVERAKFRLFIRLSSEMADAFEAIEPAPSRLHFRQLAEHRRTFLRGKKLLKGEVPLDFGRD